MQPYVILHMGISVDGRIDYGTGAEGLYYSLVEGFNADADLSGSNTMLAAQLSADPQRDFPELYAIWASKPRRPALAVVDSRGRLKNWNLVLKQPFWSDFISICSRSTPQEHLNYLQDLGVKTIIAGDNQVDLRCALEELNERLAIKVVRVDSGGILNGVLLRSGLASEVNVLINPALVGGTSPKTMYVAPDLSSREGVVRLELLHNQTLEGNYVWLKYKVLN